MDSHGVPGTGGKVGAFSWLGVVRLEDAAPHNTDHQRGSTLLQKAVGLYRPKER